jgi:hypothetical protein
MTAVRKIGDIFQQCVASAEVVPSLDGETQAPLAVILHESWTPEERAAYGVYEVDTTPPEGQRWRGGFANNNGTPVATFEPIPPPPPPPTTEELEDQVQVLADQLTQADEKFVALAMTTVDLAIAGRDGLLAGRTRNQILTLFRDKVVETLRARRGL